MKEQKPALELFLNFNDKEQIKREPLVIENTTFRYQKYRDTIFVPVYPRAHVEEVIGIDYERRTVTARFVIFLTISLKVQDRDLKNFLKDHLILEFDFNQIIYYPEHRIMDNPTYIIQNTMEQEDNYVTYKIRGNIECYAAFDHMFFPYRQIEVINHMVIRSQTFKNYEIKYNAMLLKKNNQYHQFNPHIIYPEFAGYSIVYKSTNIFTDESKNQMKENFKSQDDWIRYLGKFFKLEVIHDIKPRDLLKTISNLNEENKKFSPEELTKMIFDYGTAISQQEFEEFKKQMNIDQPEVNYNEIDEELCPVKHVTFKFDMVSLKVANVLENQIPIWALGVISLYLYTSNPDIGSRYGNSILIIVSMIALLTNYRLNNVAHHAITFYQIKIMTVMIVPVLVTISTAIDFYSNENLDLGNFKLRSSQIDNPFMLVSVIVYVICFAMTVLFFLAMVVKEQFRVKDDKKIKPEKMEQEENWQNLQNLQWHHPKMMNKMVNLMVKKNSSFVVEEQTNKLSQEEIKKSTMKRLTSTVRKILLSGQMKLNQSRNSERKHQNVDNSLASKPDVTFKKVESEIHSDQHLHQ